MGWDSRSTKVTSAIRAVYLTGGNDVSDTNFSAIQPGLQGIGTGPTAKVLVIYIKVVCAVLLFIRRVFGAFVVGSAINIDDKGVERLACGIGAGFTLKSHRKRVNVAILRVFNSSLVNTGFILGIQGYQRVVVNALVTASAFQLSL